MLTQAVKDLMISADRFVDQIPTLDDKVKHLKKKVVDGLNEVIPGTLLRAHYSGQR
jgi:hypothetical protein